MKAADRHTSHPQVVNRLKRAGGHLQNVIAMIDEGKPCLEIAQQLHAVERAISAAKKALIHDHLDHCLDEALTRKGHGVDETLSEFKDIAKYL